MDSGEIPAMYDVSGPLIEHLSRQTALPTEQLRRLVDDVFAYCADTVDAYVVRRHRELSLEGLKNDAIYERLEAELRLRPFAAPELTKRQLRRMIYG